MARSLSYELEGLSRTIKIFTYCLSPHRTGEADQLLADIDDMLADLNTKLDFMTPEELGTDV